MQAEVGVGAASPVRRCLSLQQKLPIYESIAHRENATAPPVLQSKYVPHTSTYDAILPRKIPFGSSWPITSFL